ncbi:Nuclear fusion protein KAR5 [Neolecta irregularis DAH-3]|uniref:Nuclear fusion protein KAR5 n=1 Tax=Neolecta irregularis (strain DAH-3) TaxID=1198029 RepID=A0A1U7LW17_NEOID|nr:Nuclear fusion protein KAR5 [Neolecta irregularis DAH-3]|eukprot:OLL26742.1 Nuclear fusion protein KAR5 [Neolecta irregularis DAH-3]
MQVLCVCAILSTTAAALLNDISSDTVLDRLSALTTFAAAQSPCFPASASADLALLCRLPTPPFSRDRLIFAVAWAVCELEAAGLPVPAACYKPELLDSCLIQLDARPQSWTTFSGYYRETLNFCVVASKDLETRNIIALYQNISLVQLELSAILDTHLHELRKHRDESHSHDLLTLRTLTEITSKLGLIFNDLDRLHPIVMRHISHLDTTLSSLDAELQTTVNIVKHSRSELHELFNDNLSIIEQQRDSLLQMNEQAAQLSRSNSQISTKVRVAADEMLFQIETVDSTLLPSVIGKITSLTEFVTLLLNQTEGLTTQSIQLHSYLNDNLNRASNAKAEFESLTVGLRNISEDLDSRSIVIVQRLTEVASAVASLADNSNRTLMRFSYFRQSLISIFLFGLIFNFTRSTIASLLILMVTLYSLQSAKSKSLAFIVIILLCAYSFPFQVGWSMRTLRNTRALGIPHRSRRLYLHSHVEEFDIRHF